MNVNDDMNVYRNKNKSRNKYRNKNSDSCDNDHDNEIENKNKNEDIIMIRIEIGQIILMQGTEHPLAQTSFLSLSQLNINTNIILSFCWIT